MHDQISKFLPLQIPLRPSLLLRLLALSFYRRYASLIGQWTSGWLEGPLTTIHIQIHSLVL